MKLGVFYEERLTGEIEQTESGGMQFKYEKSWLNDKDAFALSYSLPKEDKTFAKEADSFFSNCLPEGPVRQAICEKMGISVDNDFALLKQIGGECAGALVISESTPRQEENQYEELPQKKLEELTKKENVYATLTEVENMRLSLAGAQDKLPIYLEADKTIMLPLGAAPSTHILKFSNSRFKGLVLNEYFTTLLARNLGLKTVEVKLMPVAGDHFLLVERYDRLVSASKVKRLHQEDLCQALGVSHKKKYEKEQGPSFAQAYSLVTKASSEPLLNNERILKWQIANVFIGNCDGHAKNISLLRTADEKWNLTPFYDLVSTIAFPKLSRDLAMSIGGASDIGNIVPVHWVKFAEAIKVGPKVIQPIINKFIEDFPGAMETTNKQVLNECGEQSALLGITESLQKNFEVIKKRLKT